MTHTATLGVGAAEREATPVRRAAATDPCVLVIFGVTGDLSRRKLVPALYHLARSGALPVHFAVVGVSRSAGEAPVLRGRLGEAMARFSRTGVDEQTWDAFAQRIETVQGSATEPETFSRLRERLDEVDAAHGTGGNRLFYLAVAPRLFGPILEGLRSAGLIRAADDPHWTRVIIEKPFGTDRESASALNRLVGAVLDEQQTYRIDHYLGKETVQNLLVFRFANSIFEPMWNRAYVEQVQVTAAESLLVTGRGSFYDQTGVARDIVQNHLLQILALVAMEPPVSLAADDIRDQKVQLIRSLRPVDPFRDVAFGQYQGYHRVEGVAPGSRTPTFIAIKAMIDNWRWHGVPFYLRAGKGLSARDTEVAITFRPIPTVLFGERRHVNPNQLVLQIQPDEGISLTFASKVPGEDVHIGSVTMKMTYEEAFERATGEAYERLLLDAMRGDATLFARRDEVEEAWGFVDRIVGPCERGETEVEVYEPGADFTTGAAALLAPSGHTWRPLGT
jgi:glucose-6-phosphate 1-dehydrogenase